MSDVGRLGGLGVPQQAPSRCATSARPIFVEIRTMRPHLGPSLPPTHRTKNMEVILPALLRKRLFPSSCTIAFFLFEAPLRVHSRAELCGTNAQGTVLAVLQICPTLARARMCDRGAAVDYLPRHPNHDQPTLGLKGPHAVRPGSQQRQASGRVHRSLLRGAAVLPRVCRSRGRTSTSSETTAGPASACPG